MRRSPMFPACRYAADSRHCATWAPTLWLVITLIGMRVRERRAEWGGDVRPYLEMWENRVSSITPGADRDTGHRNRQLPTAAKYSG